MQNHLLQIHKTTGQLLILLLLKKAGIVKGEGNGIFNPSGKVTRAAMATMLVNAYKLQSTPNHNDQVRFEDLKGHWGRKNMPIF